MTIRRIAAALCCVLPLLLSAPSTVDAQTDDDALARRLFETGRAYFERAQYEEAVESFAEAYRLSERPSLLVNLARAQEELGDTAEAIESLTLALEVLPADDQMRPIVTNRLVRLQAEQERAEAAGLEAVAAEEAAEDAAEEEWEADSSVMWWSGVGAISLAGASFVIALGTGVASHRIHEDLQENCPMDVCLPEYEADRDRGQALSATATAFVVVGVAASATGLVLMLLARDHDEAEPALQITAGPGQVGTGLRLRF